MEDQGPGRGEQPMIMEIPLDQIEVNYEDNYSREHITPESCEELAASIEQNGLLVPVRVKPNGDGYKLVMGYRRYTACQMLGAETIRAEVFDTDTEQSKLHNVIENLERSEPSYWEWCLALKQLFPEGVSVPFIAKQLSKSTTWVEVRWKVWKLPPEVIEQVAAGFLGSSDVRMILRRPKEEQLATAETVAKAKREGKNRDKIERQLGQMKRVPKQEIMATMTELLQLGHQREMHALRYTLGDITKEELLELLK